MYYIQNENFELNKAFQKEKDGKQKDEGVSFHMKPTGWFRAGQSRILTQDTIQGSNHR